MEALPGTLELLFAHLIRPIRRRFSTVVVADGSIRLRNLPGRTKHFTIDQVERFDWKLDEDGQIGVLLLSDGSAVPVDALGDDRPGAVAALNNALRDARSRRHEKLRPS